jgi:hypothetical protein
MVRRLLLSLALLSGVADPARAADIFPEVYGVAEFPTTSPKTDLVSTAQVLPGGGRTFDFGQFGPGGSLCSAYTGQTDYLCASASARVEIDRRLVETTTYIGTATAVRLKAQVHVDYRNATATSAQIWAKASITIPLACNGAVAPPGGGLNILYRLDGDYSVTPSDPAVTVKAPRPFEDCTPGGTCTINLPDFHCPEGAGTSVVVIELGPIVQIDNTIGHTGWSVQAVSDYSHTFTLEGIDALDDQGEPLPDVRLVVPGDGDTLNDVFLTGAEAAEVAASSTTTTTGVTSTTTTTTITGATSTTTTTTITGATTTSTTVSISTPTTSTTVPPACASGDLAAAGCRCALGPAAGCDGVTLGKPVGKGLASLCAKIAAATSASGKKQRRLARQAVAIARKTLRTVDGRKGKAIPDACRARLRGFLQATQADVASATH